MRHIRMGIANPHKFYIFGKRMNASKIFTVLT